MSEQAKLPTRTRASAAIRTIATVLFLAMFAAGCGGTEEPNDAGVASVDDLAPVSSTTTEAPTDDAVTTTSETATTTTEAEAMTPIEEQELALLDLSACMRDEGIDNFPDVGVSNDGAIDVAAVLQAGVNPQSPEFTEALGVCSVNVQDVTFSAAALPNPADIVDQLFGFTQCIRDEGIDVGDVEVTDLLARQNNVPADVSSREEGIAFFFELDPDDPAAIAAIGVCEGELVGLPGAG